MAIGSGENTHKSGNVSRFVYRDVFTFRDESICSVETAGGHDLAAGRA